MQLPDALPACGFCVALAHSNIPSKAAFACAHVCRCSQAQPTAPVLFQALTGAVLLRQKSSKPLSLGQGVPSWGVISGGSRTSLIPLSASIAQACAVAVFVKALWSPGTARGSA